MDPANNNYADGQGNNQAYRCSPVNPRFWGWDEFFNLFDKILEKAQSVGLELHEFDLANEVNLQDFTVSARLIYDNVSSTPVFQRLDSMMIQRGFRSGRATVSVGVSVPGVGREPTCGSVYGDAARLMLASQVLAATGGAHVGGPPFVAWNGTMPCDGSRPFCGSPDPSQPDYNPNWTNCATAGMIVLPGVQATRAVVDVHNTPCVVLDENTPGCLTDVDVTSTAQSASNDIYNFVYYRNLSGALVLFGETWANNQNCDGGTALMVQQSVTGYLASTLYSWYGANVHVRPWESARHVACRPTPANLAPYRP